MKIRHAGLQAIALFLIFAASALGATKIGETKLPNGLKVHEYRLKNGMQLLFVPDGSAPVFTYQVWVKAGSAAEKLDPKLQRTGLAHLFEHMMFRGTKKNPDSKFDERLTSAGAEGMNATTWLDRTNFFESLPADRLELPFELESDRMANLALDEKLFKTELGAVLGEYRMNEDKPMRVAYREMWNLAFDVSPYKWDTIGTLEELHGFKVEEAQYFYKTYYAPNDAALVLIGDFKIPRALALAEKYYGKLPHQDVPHPTLPVEPEQKKMRERRVGHPLASTEILLMGYRTPELTHPDSPALEALAALLAYGDGSLLEKSLVTGGYASSTFATAYKLRLPALFMIGAQAAPGKDAGDLEKRIRKEIEKVKSGEITEKELLRAKNQFLLGSYTELGSQSSIGENLGESLVSSDDFTASFRLLEAVKKVTLADIKRVADTYLVDDHLSRIVVYPDKKTAKAEKGGN